jgi:probable rRNA maturation factor
MIYIDNRQEKIEYENSVEENIRNVIEVTLKEEKVNFPVEVSIIFVDNESIRELNNEFRNIDKATDVLSFPMIDYPKDKVYKEAYLNQDLDSSFFNEDCLVLGDIALSLERALEQSKEYNHSFEREVCYLVVHSMLHLLGYDHMQDNEKNKMREREEHILTILNIVRE